MNLTLYNKGIVINAGCFFFKGQESPTSFLKLKGLLLIHFSRQCLGHMYHVVSCTAEVYYFFLIRRLWAQLALPGSLSSAQFPKVSCGLEAMESRPI